VIIKMTKVEILGPKENANEVLEALKGCGSIHLDHWDQDVHSLPCLADNPDVLSRHLYFRDALEDIEAVLKLIPQGSFRAAYICPGTLLPSLLSLNKKHVKQMQTARQNIINIQNVLQLHHQNIELATALLPELHDKAFNHQLSMIAVKLDNEASLVQLRENLARAFDGEYELITAPLGDHDLAIAIFLPEAHIKTLQSLLESAHIPEQNNLRTSNHTTLADYLESEKEQVNILFHQLENLEKEQEGFQSRWAPFYLSCRDWLIEQLETHLQHNCIKETTMCFAINGWVPLDEVNILKEKMENTFAGKVTLQELEIQQKDLEDVPVMLRNPPYLKPFEIFTRLLPLPRYTSLDPTPFLGLFLPIFFGMILGDAGYAIILLILGITGWILLRDHPWVRDASKVLTICSIYTGLFGVLYGEFFGEQGAHLIGLHPLIMSRSGTLMPMMYFTLAVGGFHILTGLTLGAFSSFLQHQIKEGTFRSLSLLTVLIFGILTLTLFISSLHHLRMPLLITVGITIPALIITGGFLAPLEMLKHLGHIISYTRIMAVGMTSVMLAYVANRLAGEAGTLAVGILVGVLLHLFNIVLGIFAPTVHALRLHYVEFFSKFYESGGRQYSPLKPASKNKTKGDVWKT